ncbi:MAG TPA: lytic murein transglycosylase [Pilimelia sp.]|nr:lytic murein transglycosylase [Pilimelia sp.]
MDPGSAEPGRATRDPGPVRGGSPPLRDGAPPPQAAAVVRHRAPRSGPSAGLAAGGRVARRAGEGLRRAAGGARAWTRRPAGRFAVPAFLLSASLAVAILTGAVLVPAAGRPAPRPTPPAAGQPSAPGPEGPTVAPSSAAQPPGTAPSGPDPGAVGPTGGSPGATAGAPAGGRPADVLRPWAEQLAAKVEVPPVALQAYGYAELVTGRTTPGCRLQWTTLAAIGKVESDHGRANGATLGPDGRALPAILGDPLDGTGGRQAIRDTDGGMLDGDRTWDRAVGPMQFIPGTWRSEAVDADGDGVRDPNDIDDAALAAARYLCHAGRDLSRIQDWWAAVLSYNAVQPYARAVYDTANAYGTRSRG